MSAAALDDVLVDDVGGAPNGSLRSDAATGAPLRHIDLTTAELDRYARSWIDAQQFRKALAQRDMPESVVEEFLRFEKHLSALLTRTLRKHMLWPWLSQFPGLGGAHTALVIGRIGDPRRYPGQRCSEGHYLPPLYAVGALCPVADARNEDDHAPGDGDSITADDLAALEASHGRDPSGAAAEVAVEAASHDVAVCPGTMFAPRPGTGVRSLWHWAGLHVEHDGRAPRKRKGTKATWEPRVRASVMQPGGIAEQIVRLNVPHYVDVYRSTKERLSMRVASRDGIDDSRGRHELGAVEDVAAVGDSLGLPLRPFEADRIARKVAAKAFLGDLLVEWKRLVAPESPTEIEALHGGDQ